MESPIIVRRARVAISLALMLLGSATLPGAERRPSPKLQVATIPEPPQQRKDDAFAELKLPQELLSALKTLREQGFADPRGCEYREIEIGTGNCWQGDNGVVETHGWVLPAQPNEQQQFAVCWNGLVYPIVASGAKADLRVDILAMLKSDDELHAQAAAHWQHRRAWKEADSVSYKTFSLLKLGLLASVQETELAERVWKSWRADVHGDKPADPYRAIASDWLWARFDRALCAHMRGDDRLALADARALGEQHKAVEAEAKRRGYPQQQDSDSSGKPTGKLRPYITFLKPLPALLADQERRAKQTNQPPAAKSETKAALQRASVAELIERFEEIAQRQMGQPGGVFTGFDPVVLALVAKGDAAVEPLLKCLEQDERLTRSVGFGRDFGEHREIIPVVNPAYETLAKILNTDSFDGESRRSVMRSDRDERAKVAAAIRKYWRKTQNLTLQERWYRTLADDSAAEAAWLEAALKIVATSRPIGEPREPGKQYPPAGEILRAKQDPSVAELLAKRVAALGEPQTHSSEDIFRLHAGTQLALALASWDAAAAKPVLRAQFARCRQVEEFERPTRDISELTIASAQAGDADALERYASWIRAAERDDIRDELAVALRPLWRYIDDARTVAVSEWLFEDPKSPWNPLLQKGNGFRTHDLIASPLLSVAAFRRQLLKELTNKTPTGKVTTRTGHQPNVSMLDGGSMSQGSYYADDPLAPPTGTTSEFRACDFHAWILSAADGTPPCELYWPEAKRDEATARAIAVIEQYGARFTFHDSDESEAYSFGHGKAMMKFAPLDHPATKDEVRRGEAIFSLEDQGERRLWKMPARPLSAKWKALKDFPFSVQYAGPQGSGLETRYEQRGRIWQAEELRQADKWQRYYGFVGKYLVAKAPAEEIEFPADDTWTSLSSGLDVRFEFAGRFVTQYPPAKSWPVGEPLSVVVQLRNRRGVPQSAPATCVRLLKPNEPQLPVGAKLTLEYTKEEPPVGDAADNTVDSAWRRIEPKLKSRFTPDARRSLEPTEEFVAGRFNLDDLYDLSRAGQYRLKVAFSTDDGCFASGETTWLRLSLEDRSPR